MWTFLRIIVRRMCGESSLILNADARPWVTGNTWNPALIDACLKVFLAICNLWLNGLLPHFTGFNLFCAKSG